MSDQNKVKVLYDWYGPNGPMLNNYAPNILQIASTMNSTHVGDWKNYINPHVANNVFKFIDGYEFVPSCSMINEIPKSSDDRFIYEYVMNWRQPEGFFFGVGNGCIENSYISPEILHRIRHHNGYILLEYTCEAFLDHSMFKLMHDYFSNHGIPLNKIIYQTGCPNAEEVYKKWCDSHNLPEDNRMHVIFFEWIEWNLSKRFYNEEPFQLGETFEFIEKDFLCLNRRYRTHRISLLMVFYKLDLLKNSYFSTYDIHPDFPGSEQHKWKYQADRTFAHLVGLEEEDIHKIQELLPLKFDHVVDFSAMIQDEDRKLKHWYRTSLISVVTETNFHINHISTTEKTFKPMFYKHPFILVGAQHSLKYLKKGGYKTFNDFWDESYDDIQEPNIRLMKIGQVCKEIADWNPDQKREFYDKSREIVEHNYQLLRSRFPNNMPNKFWIDFRDGKIR